MLIDNNKREILNDLFQIIRLQARSTFVSLDNKVKIEQIIAYLEIIHNEIVKLSKDKKVIMIDSAAGNCYLSYLVYFYFQKFKDRMIEIHCVDYNKRLMDNNQKLAQKLGFENMHFYASDINEFSFNKDVDIVYSLHACDKATDMSIYLGIRSNAKAILSVSCCQNTLSIKSKELKSVFRFKSFKDKILMMVADSLRVLLLEDKSYDVDVFEFVPIGFTDKNIMVRAIKNKNKQVKDYKTEYNQISNEFRIKPFLGDLMGVT